MANRNTYRVEKFCLLVVEGKPLAEAFWGAGFSKNNSYETAKRAAKRLAKKPEIAARIEELKAKHEAALIEKTVATKLEAGQVATEILRARFSDFDIDKLTKKQMKSPALKRVMRQHFQGGKEGRATQITTKIELESPLAAANFLAELYGWKEQLPGYQDNRQYNIIVMDEKTRELTDKIVRGERRLGNGSG